MSFRQWVKRASYLLIEESRKSSRTFFWQNFKSVFPKTPESILTLIGGLAAFVSRLSHPSRAEPTLIHRSSFQTMTGTSFVAGRLGDRLSVLFFLSLVDRRPFHQAHYYVVLDIQRLQEDASHRLRDKFCRVLAVIVLYEALAVSPSSFVVASRIVCSRLLFSLSPEFSSVKASFLGSGWG